MSDIPWIIKNPSNWFDHNRRCEIGTKYCIFSAWQYRDRRLALSLPAIDVLYNREQYYLFFNRCPWPILLTWCAIKFQSERRIIYAILIPLHPNQPLGETYIFFLYFSVFSFSQRHLHITLHTKQVCLYVILKFFKWLQEWLKTT